MNKNRTREEQEEINQARRDFDKARQAGTPMPPKKVLEKWNLESGLSGAREPNRKKK